jgi:hypothetical protein
MAVAFIPVRWDLPCFVVSVPWVARDFLSPYVSTKLKKHVGQPLRSINLVSNVKRFLSRSYHIIIVLPLTSRSPCSLFETVSSWVARSKPELSQWEKQKSSSMKNRHKTFRIVDMVGTGKEFTPCIKLLYYFILR